MLPPSPLVTCGVPIGCSEWLRPDVIAPEFGCSTAGCHGDEDKWGDSREGTSLSVTSEVHKGNQVPLRNSGVPECAGRQGNVRHKPCKDCRYDTDRCLRGCAVSSEF